MTHGFAKYLLSQNTYSSKFLHQLFPLVEKTATSILRYTCSTSLVMPPLPEDNEEYTTYLQFEELYTRILDLETFIRSHRKSGGIEESLPELKTITMPVLRKKRPNMVRRLKLTH